MNDLFPNDRRLLRLSTAALGAALWGSMLLGFYALVYSPLKHHEDSQRDRIAVLRQLLQSDSNVHATHRELRLLEEELKTQIADVRQRIPDEPLEAAFLSDATSIAHKEQLVIENFRRQAIDDFKDYSEVDVVINGRGNYASICRFLQSVSQLNRLSTVRQLSIENDRRANQYPFEVVYSLQFGMHTQMDDGIPGKEARL